MHSSTLILKKLIERYDYGGALEVYKEAGFHAADSECLLESCRCAVNFDFENALKYLHGVTDERKKNENFLKIYENVKLLNQGDPSALLSELLENLKFQIVNEEYINFLGRVYRFKEAIYKFMFLKTQMQSRTFTFQSRFMQKKEILKVLRNHYKIYNNHLIFALNSYFTKHVTHDLEVGFVIKVMNTNEMNQLIELRHDSIIGHGFRGVSYDDVVATYGDPYSVLDDFRDCIQKLGIDLYRYKYSDMNTLIMQWLKEEGI